jgi:hypothetical protein
MLLAEIGRIRHDRSTIRNASAERADSLTSVETLTRDHLSRRELGLACVCAGLLTIEVCLTRVFSIVLWYHFGFLAVSTALLGFAGSGVWLALKPHAETGAAADHPIARSAGLGALAVVASLWLMTQTTFDVYTIVQDRTVGVLVAFVLWVTVPFFFLGLVISRALSAFPERVGKLYAADLIGSACGCAAAVWILAQDVSAQHVILAGATAIAAGGLLFAGGRPRSLLFATAGLAAPLFFLAAGGPEDAFPLRSPKSKPYYRVEHLAQELKDKGQPLWFRGATRLKNGLVVEGEVPEGFAGALSADQKTVTLQTDDGPQAIPLADIAPSQDGGLAWESQPWSPFRRWSSLSRVDAFHWPYVHGDWGLWGVSDRWRQDGVVMPRQKGITIDAWAMTSIMRWSGKPLFPPGSPPVDAERKKVEILEYLPAGTVHRIKPEAGHIVCIGAGGGLDLLTAKYFGCKQITGVEINPHVIGAVREGFPAFSGWLYDKDRHHEIRVHNAEGRHFLERTQDRYDIVQLSGVDTYSSSEAGTFALSENFLYTLEAFDSYYDRLQPGGVLTLTRWFVTHRDRDQRLVSPEAMRLMALARGSLERRGLRYRDCIYFLMSKGFTVILVKPDGFTTAELATLDRHCADYGFPVLYTPARPTPQITTPTGEKVANFLQEMLEAKDLEALLSQSEFDVLPPVDDRPFYFEWSRLRHILDPDHYFNMLGGLTAHGTLVLLFVEVALLGILFVLWPLQRLRRSQVFPGAARVKAGLLLYFTAIGFGFIVVEIILSQKFVLFLGHPFHALATILCSLLLFSGIGAAVSSRFPFPSLATLLVAVLSLIPAFLFDFVFAWFLHLALPLRVLLSVLIMAPVGLAMGVPFPTGIRVLAHVRPQLIPWAWGINGYTSVVGSVLAVLLGIELGFMAVLVSAAAVYALGVLGYWLMDLRSPDKEETGEKTEAAVAGEEAGAVEAVREPGS